MPQINSSYKLNIFLTPNLTPFKKEPNRTTHFEQPGRFSIFCYGIPPYQQVESFRGRAGTKFTCFTAAEKLTHAMEHAYADKIYGIKKKNVSKNRTA